MIDLPTELARENAPDVDPAKLPLVVAIHGMGDNPKNWIGDWKRFPAKAQIVLPQAFDRLGDGYSWFAFKDGMTDEQFGAAVDAAEKRLWPALVELAAGRKLIVTGFSQGGILSFALAARHPDAIVHAFPVAGACPGPVLPKAHAAPVTAFHGTADNVIEIKVGSRDRPCVPGVRQPGRAPRVSRRRAPDEPGDPSRPLGRDHAGATGQLTVSGAASRSPSDDRCRVP